MHIFLVVVACVAITIAAARTLKVLFQFISLAAGGNEKIEINFVALLWAAIGTLSLVLANYVH